MCFYCVNSFITISSVHRSVLTGISRYVDQLYYTLSIFCFSYFISSVGNSKTLGPFILVRGSGRWAHYYANNKIDSELRILFSH